MALWILKHGWDSKLKGYGLLCQEFSTPPSLRLYSIYLQRFPPDHHGCASLPELYNTSGVVGNFSLCDTNEQTLAQSLSAVN